MHKAIRIVAAVVLAASVVAAVASDLSAKTETKAKAPPAAAKAKPIKVAIVVGGHGYDRKSFPKAWGGHEDIQCEVWKGKPYTVFDDISKFDYDVVVMFNLSSGITDTQKTNLLKLLKKGMGLVVWHHALANCQNWPEFEKIAGCKFWMKPGEAGGKKIGKSSAGHARLKMQIANADHPITKGMKDFEIQGEWYKKQTFTRDIGVLVTTDNPKSDKPIAWTVNYSGARVFGYQSGHDAKVWTHPGFRRLLGNGIRWVAGRECINTPLADATGPTGKTFKDLSAAVGFMATCLDKNDYKTLSAACAEAPKEHILKQLGTVHRKQPLTKLYAKRSFPAKGEAFKLGGHAKELGHIHVDFTKQDGAWRLKTIFMCR